MVNSMQQIKFLIIPAYICDLNYVFYIRFNPEHYPDWISDEDKISEYVNHVNCVNSFFGNISEDLYVFYHGLNKSHCFMTECCLYPYKDIFASDFNFELFIEQFSHTDEIIKKMIGFYFHNLSDAEIVEYSSSRQKVFSLIKNSEYSWEEKNKLYEFFIDPNAYILKLRYELIAVEAKLSLYYKNNYELLLNAYNNTDFEGFCSNLNGIKDLSYIRQGGLLYISYCLINKYFMKFFGISDGAIYLLGVDSGKVLHYVKNKSLPTDRSFEALSDVTRMQIIKYLSKNLETTCKDLENSLSLTGSITYHHLAILTKAGAVSTRNVGKKVYYSLNRSFFAKMIDQLNSLKN